MFSIDSFLKIFVIFAERQVQRHPGRRILMPFWPGPGFEDNKRMDTQSAKSGRTLETSFSEFILGA